MQFAFICPGFEMSPHRCKSRTLGLAHPKDEIFFFFPDRKTANCRKLKQYFPDTHKSHESPLFADEPKPELQHHHSCRAEETKSWISGSTEAKGHEKHAEYRQASAYTRLPLFIKSSNLTLRGMNSGLRALHCKGRATSPDSSFLQRGG